jgi:TATA-binding protein-associated factor Taf7
MARGWESKSIADQIEDVERRAQRREDESDRSPEARMQRERLEALRLSRARTLAQLDSASSPAYRQMLERALSALEREIEDASRTVTSG